jgi:hypothetical protein
MEKKYITGTIILFAGIYLALKQKVKIKEDYYNLCLESSEERNYLNPEY